MMHLTCVNSTKEELAGVLAEARARGIKNILAKSLGSSNHANVLKATLNALGKLRQRDAVMKIRGITLKPQPVS